MTRNHSTLRPQSLGQVALRPGTPAPGPDAWTYRAASEHPFDVGAVRPGCAGHDPELFWPATSADADAARQVCRACPLVESCLAVATQRREWGIWGGQLLARGKPTDELPGNVRPEAHRARTA